MTKKKFIPLQFLDRLIYHDYPVYTIIHNQRFINGAISDEGANIAHIHKNGFITGYLLSVHVPVHSGEPQWELTASSVVATENTAISKPMLPSEHAESYVSLRSNFKASNAQKSHTNWWCIWLKRMANEYRAGKNAREMVFKLNF